MPTLQAGESLSKMNDVLAVEVFTFNNLSRLLDDHKFLEAYYLFPFVCWYAVISIEGLSWETRLNLLRCAFCVFVDWYKRSAQLKREFLKDKKFFAEIPDIPRYLNTILFLSQVTRQKKPIAYNRIGTHPVENLFGCWISAGLSSDRSPGGLEAGAATGRCSFTDTSPP
jgi:hypothetical protein